jgi:aminoglycoside 3-N-acetyltransferase
MLTYTELMAGFKAIGLQAGDTVLVHSAFKSFGGVEGGPMAVIEALLEVLTPEGTLVMPAFNFDFTKGKPWDVRTTPSAMGIISELARTDPRFKRVFHPIYSFSIAGKYADRLTGVRYKSSYERISVFGQLRDLDAKIMVIGLSYNNSVTFFHHIEEMEGVDYRYLKAFTGEVTEADGTTTLDTFFMLVRDVERGVRTMVDPMGALAEERGISKKAMIGDAEVKIFKANELYELTRVEMRKNPNLLYYIDTGAGSASHPD